MVVSVYCKIAFADFNISLISYNNNYHIIIYDNGEQVEYVHKRIDRNFHGTGDVFASSFCGAVLNGKTILEAMSIAANYVCDCIERTLSLETPINYGVDFERGIPYYLKELGKI